MNGKDVDVMLRKLFIGGLPFHTTDKSLREHFEQYGGIDEAVVIADRTTGKSKGYGFVTMSDKEAADKACLDKNPTIDGRKANVNLAYLGAKPRRNLGHIQNGGMASAAAFLPLTTYAGQSGPGGALPAELVQQQQQQLVYQHAYLQQMQQFQQLQLQQQQLALVAGGQAASAALAVNGLQQVYGHPEYGQAPPTHQQILTSNPAAAASFSAQGASAAGFPLMATSPTNIPHATPAAAKFDQLFGQSPNMPGFVQPSTSPIAGSFSASPHMYLQH